MNREEIIKLANDAEVCQTIWIDDEGPEIDSLIRFAQLVAAAERDACLKAVMQSKVHQYIWYPKGSAIDANRLGDIYKHQHDACVDAIHARGQQ